METFTIVVRVKAPTQSAAFCYVERAIDEYVIRHVQDDEQLQEPEIFHVSTPDGTRATSF